MGELCNLGVATQCGQVGGTLSLDLPTALMASTVTSAS